MGSFSWLKADEDEIINVPYGYKFKFLIPKEFGGGSVIDEYQDYGYLGKKEDCTPKYDMYELLAFWNSESLEGKLKFDGHFPVMKEIDTYTNYNRNIGIGIGCYDKQIDLLKYPLKLVSVNFTGTYEECLGKSYGDPHQGFYPVYKE